MRWNNWSGRHQSKPAQLAFVRSEEDAAALIRQCGDRGGHLRVAGSGHSHSPLVGCDDTIIEMSGFSGVLSVNPENATAWVRAGTSIFSLGAQLHSAGFALKNQGDIDRQQIAGAISTGTHGTGKSLQNLSAGVLGATVILADGSKVTCSPSVEPDLFETLRLSLGGVGLISRVQMSLGASVVLKESGGNMHFDALLPMIPDLIEGNERFEFFWYPHSDEAIVKTINPESTPPCYPLAQEGARCAWSFEVLPNHRPHLHTEMEYSVPRDVGPACLADIRSLIQRDFPDVSWPVEYRTIAEDDIWLSMANGRDTVSISVHQDINIDEESYYQSCEEIFLSYGGRPHWGKVNYLSGAQLANAYPEWERWWQVRDTFDPQGVFLNGYLDGIRPH